MEILIAHLGNLKYKNVCADFIVSENFLIMQPFFLILEMRPLKKVFKLLNLHFHKLFGNLGLGQQNLLFYPQFQSNLWEKKVTREKQMRWGTFFETLRHLLFEGAKGIYQNEESWTTALTEAGVKSSRHLIKPLFLFVQMEECLYQFHTYYRQSTASWHYSENRKYQANSGGKEFVSNIYKRVLVSSFSELGNNSKISNFN